MNPSPLNRMQIAALVFSFLCGAVFTAKGQAWHPFPGMWKYHFAYDSTSSRPAGLRTVQVTDSSIAGGDTLFQFNPVVRFVQTGETFWCNGTTAVQGNNSTWKYGQDNLFGHSYHNLPGGRVEFKAGNGETFLIERFAGTGDSWVFNGSDTATVDSIAIGYIEGIPDSIKYISFNNSNRTLDLSRSFGMIQTFPFVPSRMFVQRGSQTSETLVPDTLHLYGIPDLSLGKDLPGFLGICGGFQQGDHSIRKTFNSDDHVSSTTNWCRKDYLAKTLYGDSIRYDILKTGQTLFYLNGSYTTYNTPTIPSFETFHLQELNFLNALPGELPKDSMGNVEWKFLSEVQLLPDNRIQYLFFRIAALDTSNCDISYPNQNGGYWLYQESLAEFYFQEVVTGFFNNHEYQCYNTSLAGSFGTCNFLVTESHPLQIPERNCFWFQSEFSEGIVHGERVQGIKLVDLQGKVVIYIDVVRQATRTLLDLSLLPQGMYIAQVLYENGDMAPLRILVSP